MMNNKTIAGIIIGAFVILALGTITNTLAQYENNSTSRIINDTKLGGNGVAINWADVDNGINVGSKTAQQNVSGDYSLSGCMTSVIHNVKDMYAYCNAFMIGFNAGKCHAMRAQVTGMENDTTQQTNSTQQLIINQLTHQYNSQCVPPQSDKIFWVWR